MAKVAVQIPDGQFCADKNHLGCLYEIHGRGVHWCALCRVHLNPLEEFRVNGERIRLRRKARECVARILDDGGKGIEVDDE